MRFSFLCILAGALAAGACNNASNQPGGGTTLGRGSDKVDGTMGGITSPGGMNPNKQPPASGAATDNGTAGSSSNRANPGGSGTGTGGNPGGTTGGNAPGGE